MRNRYFIGLIGLLLLLGQLGVRDIDDRYNRPINGDAKGYYAYLPALFIYQNPSYSFIEPIEKKYYPQDGSQFKDFLNEQPNGSQVNKTFPGITIGYAPFFGLAYVVAQLFHFVPDGYSLPFQWSIVLAHLTFVLIGLYFLIRSVEQYGIKRNTAHWLSLALLFATNTWYYVVYDQSVSHIYNMMLVCAFLFTITKWIKSNNGDFAGISMVLFALLVISRPTNALVLLFLPLLFKMNKLTLGDIKTKLFHLIQKRLMIYAIVCVVILIYPLILWKWQTDYWLVYSYKDEGFQFTQPHFWSFIISYQKGWLLWSPLVAIGLIVPFFSFRRSNFYLYLSFYLPLVVVVYIFSSWWCWTYGAGFGQRPMIEFLPFILLFIASTVPFIRLTITGLLIILPFSFLSIVQGYQIANSIEIGGETTKESYWRHFLQLKRDEPTVQLPDHMKLVIQKEWKGNHELSKANPFSDVIQVPVDSGDYVLVYSALIDGKHRDTTTRIVCAAQSGWYVAKFIGDDIYAGDIRRLTYSVPFYAKQRDTINVYVWNGSTEQKSKLSSLTAEIWK